MGHVYAVRRVHILNGHTFHQFNLVHSVLRTLNDRYCSIYGNTAAERKEPLSRQMLKTLLATPSGLKLSRGRTLNWDSWFGINLAAAMAVSSSGGFRKGEIALEAGAAHPAEERQLAALSQQLLQLSPAELGLAPRADIGAPHPEAGGPSAAAGTGDTAAAAPPQRATLSADLQLLETALSEPVDVHGAVTVLLRLVQRRLDAADEVATQRDRSADVEPLLQMSAALHESVRGIREQLHLEQQQSASALAERELQLLTSLHTSSSTSRVEGATMTPAGSA